MTIIRSGKSICLILFFSILTVLSYSQDTTWYTLASGNWDDPTIWTLDPSGALPKNPDNLTPSTAVTGTTHKVVILSGRTIDVTSDNKTNASLKVLGRIDFHATTGHTFTLIKGGGTIILKDDNFPSGDASDFITAGAGEGTVIFDSTGYDLATAHTFYNVEVDLDNASDVLTLLADYQINGNLTLTQGELRINDNTSTTLLDLTVDGNVNVSANSSISVGTANAYDGGQGYYNRFHDFTVGGDFVSYGKVRLTNQTVPDYTTQTTTGAVTLHFTGASDNYFKLYDTTDLYNLHVNKGTDATYELSIYAHNKAYFALFGPNSSSYTRTVPHPQHNKALWIEAGTVRLKGEIVIPSLSEGGADWSIGQNAKFILDGENVEVYSTTMTGFIWTGFSHGQPANIVDGNGNQGISIYGDLSVENGYFSTYNSSGIIYRQEAPGSVSISGGEVNITQLRLSGASASGFYSFIQSGGVFRVRGNGQKSNSHALFSLNQSDMYFSMSGGQLIIQDYTAYTVGAIEILCADGNFNVTGGEVICDWGGTSEIYSTADIYNLSIINGTDVDMSYTLKVSNDLSIDGTSGLNAAGNDLYIQRDLLFADGAAFTHGNNTTWFYGSENSTIDIDNTTDIPGLTFYNLVVDKDQLGSSSFWDLSIANCPGRSQATADEIISIANDLTITRGQFSTERYTVSLLGNLTITDGNLVYNPALPGRLMLEGTAQQTLTGSEIYSPGFGHIDLNNTNGATIASNVALDLFTLTQGIMDINEFKFSLDTNLIIDGSGGGFSTAKMIMTQGLAGDRGLEFNYNLSASTITGTIATYPVGVAGKYTPVDVILNNTLGASYSGTYRIAPVNSIHPAALIPTTFWCNEYYWKSYITGNLGSIPANDISVNFTDPYSSYGPGKREYYLLDNDWQRLNNASSPTLSFENIGFLKSDYTAARNLAFNISWIFYSKQSGNWTDVNTWSRVGHDGTDTPTDYPRYLDVVYIGGDAIDGEHVVTINANNIECANLEIESGDAALPGEPTLDAGTRTGLAFDEVSGGGRFRISYNNNIPTGNWDNFMYNDTAIFEYYGGTYTIPTDFSVYPNLEITGSGTTKTMPNQDILVRKNMLIDTETLLLNDGNNLYINDSLTIDNAGVMQFPTNSNPCNVTVGASIDLSPSSAANTMQINTGGVNSANHSLYVYDDIILNANSVIDFYDAANNAVDLYFDGNNNSTVNDAGGAFIDLNRLTIDKSVSTADVDFLEGFTLNGATNGISSEKALYLLNGDLTINNGGTDIYLTSGGGDFNIPSTASLSVLNATVRASGTNTGIYLDGLMNVGDGSQWLLNEGTNNYIEYSASGNADIEINGSGTLRVGSQIRRNTITNDGILTFSQNSSNSTVSIGETDAPENRRGVFEILNLGSSFSQVANANITIVQAQTTPAVAALYLDPASSSVGTGATFTLGSALTPAAQDIGIYSTINLQNLKVDNSSGNNPTATEWIVDLTLNEDLTIQSGAEFDANGLNLTINGNFYNSGTFTPNSNTTYFSGTGNQRIVGNTTFYNLTKTSTGELWLAANNAAITVSNDLDIQAGTVRDSSNTVTLLGDVNFDGTHIHGTQAGEGFYFNGTGEQQLTGSGTFGKLTVNNSSGVTLPVGNNFTVTDTLKLMDGVFGIGKNLLTLNVDAEIEEANPFSSTNMIQTNVSFTDYGVRKYFPSGVKNFTYPIGSGGKYTPITLDITENTSSTGYITVKAADEMHPSIQEDTETPPIVDADNVLQYHWVMNSSGITGFRATAYMTYIPGDVAVTAPYTVYDYITARLLNDGSGLWNKYPDVDKFDEVNEWCIFDFGLTSPVDDAQISGDYTAGIDDAIPNLVPFYETNSSGTWSTSSIWTPNITGGPRGAMVRINSGDTVTTPSNFVSSYTTEIQGVVNLGTTFGHRFGDVTGTGLIYSEREVIPAGIYDEFFSSAGGTLEFGGTNDYDVLGGHAVVNNLTFSGTGQRRLPTNNLTLNGDLTINGGATLDVIVNEGYDIDIKGNMSRVGGLFDAGTNLTNTISFTSAVNQTISGYFTGANTLNTLVVNNPNGITISSGTVDIAGTLYLTNGNITTSATDTLRIGVTSLISPVSGSASSFISGPLTKVMSSGDNFTFPIGKTGGGLGLIDINNITGLTGVNTDVSVEYFFDNPNTIGNVTQVGSGVNTVSQSEYWSVDVMGGGQSTVDITLDGSSDVANALSDINDLIIVGWSGTQWEQIGGTYTITGTSTSGSISCNTDIDYNSYQYITLGSSVAITIITGTILSADYSICSGDAASITLAFTGGTAPWTYTLNGTDYVAASSPHVHNITPAPTTTTTYTLSAVSDATPTAGSVVGNVDVVVTVNAIPTPTLSPSTGTTICSGDNVIFTAGTGSNYDFYLNSGLVQSGTASAYTNSSLTNGDVVDVIVTSSDGCSSSLGTVPVTMTVIAAPAPTIAGADTSCEGNTDTYTTAATGNTFTWSVTTHGVLQIAQGTETMDIQWNTLTPAGTLQSTETVTVVEDNGTCTGNDTYNVDVFRTPQTGPQYHIGNTWNP